MPCSPYTVSKSIRYSRVDHQNHIIQITMKARAIVQMKNNAILTFAVRPYAHNILSFEDQSHMWFLPILLHGHGNRHPY